MRELNIRSAEIGQRDRAQVAAVRAMIAPPGLVPVFPPDHHKARAGHDGMARMFPVVAGTMLKSVELGGVTAEKITPPNANGTKAILYLHGWGFALGSMASHRHLVAQLSAASGAVGYTLDYRLAPEAQFPAAIHDGVSAFQALLALGLTPSDIVIAGDSSGAGLAVSIALAVRDQGLPQPAGLFLMSPWVDLALSGARYGVKADVDFMCNKAELAHWAHLYAGETHVYDPHVSPLYADLVELAPMLIHAGSEEILLSDAVRLAERASMADVAVTLSVAAYMPHTYHYMWPFLTAGRDALATAGSWIAEV